jgi:hypothetical protein
VTTNGVPACRFFDMTNKAFERLPPLLQLRFSFLTFSNNFLYGFVAFIHNKSYDKNSIVFFAKPILSNSKQAFLTKK